MNTNIVHLETKIEEDTTEKITATTLREIATIETTTSRVENNSRMNVAYMMGTNGATAV